MTAKLAEWASYPEGRGGKPFQRGAIEPRGRFPRFDWQIARKKIAGNSRFVKITLPAPMTIADTIVDEYYGNDEKPNKALAEILNVEARDLAGATCGWDPGGRAVIRLLR